VPDFQRLEFSNCAPEASIRSYRPRHMSSPAARAQTAAIVSSRLRIDLPTHHSPMRAAGRPTERLVSGYRSPTMERSKESERLQPSLLKLRTKSFSIDAMLKVFVALTPCRRGDQTIAPPVPTTNQTYLARRCSKPKLNAEGSTPRRPFQNYEGFLRLTMRRSIDPSFAWPSSSGA
jgi:hypothetical protein